MFFAHHHFSIVPYFVVIVDHADINCLLVFGRFLTVINAVFVPLYHWILRLLYAQNVVDRLEVAKYLLWVGMQV